MRRCGRSTSPRTRPNASAPVARLTFDEAVGLQWALVGRRYGELSESGPVAPREDGGWLAAMREQLPFELTAGQKEVLEVLSAELAASRPMNRMLQGEVGSGKTIVSRAGDVADGRRGIPVRAAGADGSPCRPTCPVDPRCARAAGDGGSARRCRPRDAGRAADRIDVAAAEAGGARRGRQRRGGHRHRHACADAGGGRVPPASAWWWSTSSTGSVSSSETSCAPRPLTDSRRICW